MKRERLLVVRLGAIGDALRVLPAVRRLRRARPEATIGWAVEQWVYPLLAGNPNVDRFHILDRGELRAGLGRARAECSRFVHELRAGHYDLVLDFHARLKSGLVGLCSGAPLRIGYARRNATEANHLFHNIHVSLKDNWENRVLRHLHLLAPLGIETGYDPEDLGLYQVPGLRDTARLWYEEARRPALALYPGCSVRGSSKKWPLEKWKQLLARLGRQEIRSALFWGPGEQAAAREIAAAGGGSCVLAPATSLPEMLAMIGCFRAFLGSNTAAMHMAWMQGVPTALFVGRRPVRTDAPLPPVPSLVLQATGSRSRARRGRTEGVAGEVADVTVDVALSAVRALLDAAGRATNDSAASK